MTATAPSFVQQDRAFRDGRFLRVLNYHNTPPRMADELERELAAYLADSDPVTPDDLDSFHATGRWPGGRPRFLAGFYDGYRNNATVAAPVCERLGLTAWFFIPTGFLSAAPADQWAFAARHRIRLLREERSQDRLAMTWDDLGGLAERHIVAAHSATHTRAEDVHTDADVERELVEPRDLVQKYAGRPPLTVAWREGAAWDPADHQLERASRALVAAGYRFVMSNTMLQRVARTT